MKKLTLVILLYTVNIVYGQLLIKFQEGQYSIGYIDNATLIIEPHGAYSLQTLILEYSDHSLFAGKKDLEIDHKFYLPYKSVINDFSIFSGDTVLKAVVVDHFTGYGLYNLKKTTSKHRPGLLFGDGDTWGFCLNVFPFNSGEIKKIKISYISPVKFEGTSAIVNLPYRLLNTNNSTKKPLSIIFKSFIGSNYEPKIYEDPNIVFTHWKDSLNYSYSSTYIQDITPYSGLNIKHNLYTFNGAFFEDGKDFEGINNFQLSLELKELFNVNKNTNGKKILIGLDLSGFSFKNLEVIKNNVNNLLKARLTNNDFFNMVIVGAEKISLLSDTWMQYNSSSVDSVLTIFNNSQHGKLINNIRKKKILVVGPPGSIKPEFYSAYIDINYADSYSNLNTSSADIILSNTTSSYGYGKFNDTTFICNGGKFISYRTYDNWPVPPEHNFIEGLKSSEYKFDYVKLSSIKSGNIGKNFPDTVNAFGGWHLLYTDSLAKNELRLADSIVEFPYIVSKLYGKGLVISTTIWPFNQFTYYDVFNVGIPMLGIYEGRSISQLPELLNKVKEEYLKNIFDEVIILSNSDSLTTDENTSEWLKSYLDQFPNNKPKFFTINLLKNNEIGHPSFFYPHEDSLWGTELLTSGYLLHQLAKNTNGHHFESKEYDLEDICYFFKQMDYPSSKEFYIEKYGDYQKDNFIEFKEVNPDSLSSINNKFFIGSTSAESTVSFKIKAKFDNSTEYQIKELSFNLNKKEDAVLPAILAYCKIKDTLSSNPFDYNEEFVKQLASKYNILAGNRSMVVLFPGETQQFLYDYLDVDKDENTSLDYDIISAYPNPFNAETQILVKLKEPGKVNISIYNILGQLVTRIAENEEVIGSKTYTWNGKEDYNITASSGIYFTKVEIENSKTKEKKIKTLKLMMLK